MPSFDVTGMRTHINIFKLSDGYYFKHFFDDPELFRELEQFYEKQRYRFKKITVGERNKIMKLFNRKGYDPMVIEHPAPYIVEISKYQKYGELLKNSVESYPLRDKVVLVMKDMALVEQAVAMGVRVLSLVVRIYFGFIPYSKEFFPVFFCKFCIHDVYLCKKFFGI